MPIFTVRCGSAVLYHGDSPDAILSCWQSDRAAVSRLSPTAPLTFFSVCSGIEAASVAWKPLGWRCVGVAEIEKFPAAVLTHHYPNVPNHGDFTKINTGRLGRIDILCGGTPCQAFSIAGARRSLDDARGNLTLAFVGLAHELAAGNGLRNVVWENVPGVLSTKDNAFGCFLAGLVGADEPFVPAESKPLTGKSNRRWGWSAKEQSHYVKWSRAGVVVGPKGRAAWTVKDAQYFGLAQRRERVLVVADFGNGADPAAVLFEPEGVRRDSPPSREAGQRVAPTISARPTGGGGLGTDFDCDGGLVVGALVCNTGPNGHDAGNFASNQGVDAGYVIAVPVANPLTARMHKGINTTMDEGQTTLEARTVPQAVGAGWAVRRLTPRECERLQGFQWRCEPTFPGAWQDHSGRWWSPDYTAIPWRGKPASECPDGPRYKALGNSWAVPKFRWLGERIARLMP